VLSFLGNVIDFLTSQHALVAGALAFVVGHLHNAAVGRALDAAKHALAVAEQVHQRVREAMKSALAMAAALDIPAAEVRAYVWKQARDGIARLELPIGGDELLAILAHELDLVVADYANSHLGTEVTDLADKAAAVAPAMKQAEAEGKARGAELADLVTIVHDDDADTGKTAATAAAAPALPTTTP
jgi:hypothetical protein